MSKLSLTKINCGQNFRTNEDGVSTLMASIKQHGLLQPIVVSKAKVRGGKHDLIAGFRRFIAVKKLGWTDIDVTYSDINKTIGNITENLQRKDPEVYEIGRGINSLIVNEKMNKKEIAVKLGLNLITIDKYLDIYKLVPLKFRKIIKNAGRGHTLRKGNDYIPSTVAHRIFNLKKKGAINSTHVRTLLELTLQNPDVTTMNITRIANKLAMGGSVSGAIKSAAVVREFTLRLMISETEAVAIENKTGKPLGVALRAYFQKNIRKIRMEIPAMKNK